MAKRNARRDVLKDVKLPSREEMEQRMAERRKAEKKRRKKEKRDFRHAHIRSVMKATRFSARQVIGLMKNFSSIHHDHGSGRIGPPYDDE